MEKLSSKKGNILDWFVIIIFMFFLAILLVTVIHVVDKIDNSGVFATTTEADEIMTKTQNSLLNFDGLMVFILIGLSIFTLVSAYFVFNHPAFFFLSFVLLCIAIAISATFSNAYSSINVGDITATTAQLPKINYIMEKLPLYVLFMGTGTLVVMGISYKKENG